MLKTWGIFFRVEGLKYAFIFSILGCFVIPKHTSGNGRDRQIENNLFLT